MLTIPKSWVDGNGGGSIAFSVITIPECTKRTYATRPLSRCYLRSYLVKTTTGAHKEPSKKYKSNLEEQVTSISKSNLKNL